jgi:RHS repeat-associated protein
MVGSTSSTLDGSYEYDPKNHRVYQLQQSYSGSSWTTTGQYYYFYGLNGKKIGSYTATISGFGSGAAITWSLYTTQVFFKGRLIKDPSGVEQSDVRGSVGKYYPYGENRGTPPPDSVQFATYTGDSMTGLNYAVNRYYVPGVARFLTADRSRRSAKRGDPSSWNRYSYVQGDPIGHRDVRGLMPTRADNDSAGDDDVNCDSDCDEQDPVVQPPAAEPPEEDASFSLNTLLAQYGYDPVADGLPPNPQISSNSYDSTVQGQFTDGFQSALQLAMSPLCAGALAPSSSILASVVAATYTLLNTQYDLVGLGAGEGAETAQGGTNVLVSQIGGTLNSDGSVTFSNFPTASGGTASVTFISITAAYAFVVLHELGHETGAFPADGGLGQTGQNGANSAMVLDDCFSQNSAGVYH